MIDKDVMVYSVRRTGSTLIWQCLAQLFSHVKKAHCCTIQPDCVWEDTRDENISIFTSAQDTIFNNSCPCVITERNLIDCFLSQWRTDNFQTEAHFHEWLRLAYQEEAVPVKWPIQEYSGWSHQNDESQILDMHKFKEACDKATAKCFSNANFQPVDATVRCVRKMMTHFRQNWINLEIFKTKYKGPILVLQYEDFWDNYDYIFAKFEEFFSITISEETKTEIRNTTNRSVNRIKQEKLKGFKDHDNVSHLNGGHIFTGEPGWSSQVLGEKNLQRIQTLLDCDFAEIMNIALD